MVEFHAVNRIKQYDSNRFSLLRFFLSLSDSIWLQMANDFKEELKTKTRPKPKCESFIYRCCHLCWVWLQCVAYGNDHEQAHMFYLFAVEIWTDKHVLKLTKPNILNDSIFFGHVMNIVRVLLLVVIFSFFLHSLPCSLRICRSIIIYIVLTALSLTFFVYLTQNSPFRWCNVLPKKRLNHLIITLLFYTHNTHSAQAHAHITYSIDRNMEIGKSKHVRKKRKHLSSVVRVKRLMSTGHRRTARISGHSHSHKTQHTHTHILFTTKHTSLKSLIYNLYTILRL